MNKRLSSYFAAGLMACLVGFSGNKAEAQEVFSNNWYVGNTEAGEWIRYKQVYLAEGDYRFTTRVAARRDNCKLHLELNNETLVSGVKVPATQNGEFTLVHLGHKHLKKGYYDIKLFLIRMISTVT
jgi:coagulation factor 5/8 type domain protein